jgi:hypothetical protein
VLIGEPARAIFNSYFGQLALLLFIVNSFAQKNLQLVLESLGTPLECYRPLGDIIRQYG